MKLFATLALSTVLALPAGAAVVWDEGVNGDLSSDAANPTAIAFAIGANTIIGSMGNVGTPADVRDYITFTIGPNQLLSHLNLIAYAPANLGFASFNSGNTSFIPSVATDPLFLSGIHVSAADVGMDLMPVFVSASVTQNSLPQPELGPGSYCFLIQQTSPITNTYTLDFVLDEGTPAARSTWGVIKRLYR